MARGARRPRAPDYVVRGEIDLSVVVPIYNERQNLQPLVADIMAELGRLGGSAELILVNDGSSDGSAEELDRLAASDARVRVLHFAHNCGQTLALAAGMDESRGRAIVLMDGDRQNDPADIGMLLAKLDEGYGCVSGWRRDRQDTGLRRFVSRVANRIINGLAGVPIHDLGCTLKAYRADAIDPRDLFGEMHRFLPLFVMARGGKVTELVVRHHPRTAGVSKYGFNRIYRVISDIMLVRVLLKYRTRPSHFFARLAWFLVLGGGAFFALCAALQLAAGGGWLVVGWFTLLAAVLGGLALVGIGIACELVMRNRYWLADRRPWTIARRINFDPSN